MSADTLVRPLTVLIVDDSEEQAKLLRRHFEHAGCAVVISATAEHALHVYESVRPDMAVLDLMLPGMTGWELNELLSTEHPDCPVAISSVLGREDYPPANATLPKPVTRASVRQALVDCIPGWVEP